MDNKYIDIYSGINSTIILNVPSLNLKRTWARKGAVQKVPADILEIAFYEPGVEYMFRTGMLYTDDMEIKIKLGLEQPETVEPTQIIFLSDAECEKLLTQTALKDFREKVETLSHDQLIELANYAVKIRVTDYQRTKILKEKTEIDVLAMVMNSEKEEENSEE